MDRAFCVLLGFDFFDLSFLPTFGADILHLLLAPSFLTLIDSTKQAGLIGL